MGKVQGLLDYARFSKVKQFAAPKTRDVNDVDILAVGTWHSANGTVDFTAEDLDGILDISKGNDLGTLFVKAGHTPDSHNLKIAEALGIPVDMLTGKDGSGALGLGHIENLRRQGNKLIGDLKAVPSPIADMIKMDGSGLLTVSAEMQQGAILSDGKVVPWLLDGVALLGAEDPAVTDQRGLEAATILSKLKAGSLLRILKRKVKLDAHDDEAVARAAADLGLEPSASIDEIIARLQQIQQEESGDGQEDEPMDNEILKALGLVEGADTATVLAAIGALTVSGQNAGFEARVSALETENKILRRGQRVAHYLEMAKGWTHTGEKPEDVAAKLADIEESAGLEMADTIVKQHNLSTTALKSAGVFKRFSNPVDGVDADWNTEVAKYMNEKNVDKVAAIKHLQKAKSELYEASRG